MPLNLNPTEFAHEFYAFIPQQMHGEPWAVINRDPGLQGEQVLTQIFNTCKYIENTPDENGMLSANTSSSKINKNNVLGILREDTNTWRMLVNNQDSVRALKIGEESIMMDNIQEFLQQLPSYAEEINLVWIPIKNHPDIRVLYSIEWELTQEN